MDFVDGDIQFRFIHRYVDVFLDKEMGFVPLTEAPSSRRNASASYQRHEPFRDPARAAIVMAGYGTYIITVSHQISSYVILPLLFPLSAGKWGSPGAGTSGGRFTPNKFEGASLGYDGFNLKELLDAWAEVRHEIQQRFILVVMLNENWGLLSCAFPGRTAGWGRCKDYPLLQELLEDKNLVMLVVNQHHNSSHPKILTWPRGIPLHWKHSDRLMWKAMRGILHSGKGETTAPTATVAASAVEEGAGATRPVLRSTLLFSGSSSWGPRPAILDCIRRRVDEKDFLKVEKLGRERFYIEMGRAKFGIALPGLGYDCFRLWELMLLGTIPVIERGIGFDRSLWRLPALIVDDFADVSTDLLRQAYVDALYHADEFEFHRLRQSYWEELLFRSSAEQSIDFMLSQHPMEAEDPAFTRPRERYDCGWVKQQEASARGPYDVYTTPFCGAGTKRIPLQSCLANVSGGYYTGRTKKQKLADTSGSPSAQSKATDVMISPPAALTPHSKPGGRRNVIFANNDRG
jgi:hypothetical protein